MIRKDPSGGLLVVDTETSGQDPFSHHILSVGLVSYHSNDSLEVHIELPPDAIWTDYGSKNFSRFSKEWGRSALAPLKAVHSIEEFVAQVYGGREVNLVGHNIAFDRFFLAQLAHRAGVSGIRKVSHRTIDTFSLLMALCLAGRLPLEATTSSGAFAYFGIEVPTTSRHTALGDALATKMLFSKLMEMF